MDSANFPNQEHQSFLVALELVRYFIDCGSRLIPGLYETERCFYGALTDEIRDILREHRADPNKFDHLGQNLEALRTLLSTSDFQLTFEDKRMTPVASKTFPLHRFVLSARSPWFAQRLLNEWKGFSEVVLSVGMEEDLFQSLPVATAMLDFVYTSKADVDETEVEDFVQALKVLGFNDSLGRIMMKEKAKKNRELRRIVVKSEKERDLLTFQLEKCFVAFDSTQYSVLEEYPFNPALWHDLILEVQEINAESDPLSPAPIVHRFACHRALLSQHSTYFHALISGSFQEASSLRQSRSSRPVLRLDEEPRPDLLKVSLRYLYTNELETEFSVEDTISLLQLADRLMLMELKRLCAVRLRKELNQTNVFSFLFLGDSLQVRLLKQAALDFVEHHIHDLHRTEEFQEALEINSEEVVQELRFYVEDRIQQP